MSGSTTARTARRKRASRAKTSDRAPTVLPFPSDPTDRFTVEIPPAPYPQRVRVERYRLADFPSEFALPGKARVTRDGFVTRVYLDPATPNSLTACDPSSA